MNIEELSLNAWPSIQTVLYDGWVIRFAEGYSKRANSVNPIYASSISVDEKVSYCESLYSSAGLPVVFKISPYITPGDLDSILSARGYYQDSGTSVQLVDMAECNLGINLTSNIEHQLNEEWLENYCRMNVVADNKQSALRQILLNIRPEHSFVTLMHDGVAVGCGMGVLQSGFVGLFDIVIDPLHRNKGFGQELVRNILCWGRDAGAQKAYLQVMLNNMPALRLYSKMGFREKYQYWYRVKPHV